MLEQIILLEIGRKITKKNAKSHTLFHFYGFFAEKSDIASYRGEMRPNK